MLLEVSFFMVKKENVNMKLRDF